MDTTKGLSVERRVIKLLKSFPSVCTLSSLFSLLRRPPLTPPNRLPSPFSPPFQLVHPAQVWLRKRCVSLPCEPAQCVFLCEAVRRSVCVLPCTVILNDVMFSYFFASFLLDSSICSAAPLCHSPLCSVFLVCFLPVCVPLCLCRIFKQGSRAFGNSS